MGHIVAGLASSHAYTFLTPDRWDERRMNTRANYARRYGDAPPERPEVEAETLAANQSRFETVSQGLLRLRSAFEDLQPDSWILIGDDQDENYKEDNLPQFAIYVGDEFVTGGRGGDGGTSYRCDSALAGAILHGCVDADIDLASSNSFADGLISHAHRDVMRFLDPDGRVPIVPLFINAIHVPAPTPRRCYELGRVLRQVIEAQPDDKRVAIYASGGWSHFTAGFPWRHYQGPHSVGSIAVDFDRRLAADLRGGKASRVVELSSRDLLDNGDIEFRQWIVLLGALGDRKPDELVYEPFYRGVMGMAVGYWNLEETRPASDQKGQIVVRKVAIKEGDFL